MDIWKTGLYPIGKSLGFEDENLYQMRQRGIIPALHHNKFVKRARTMGLKLSHEFLDQQCKEAKGV